MADVLFKKGLQASYNAIEQKVATTFYYTTDEKNLYLGDVKISNAADLEAAITRITTNETNIKALQDLTKKLDGDATVDGSIKKQIKDAVAASEAKLAAVAISGKAADVAVEDVAGKYDATNVEAVLAEIATKISTTGDDSKVTLETTSKDEADKAGYAGVYTFKQGGKLIGAINIAKDMVATSGELVKADGDGNEGTFIKMTIANGTPFYINVKDLIEYNSVESTDEITLTDVNHTISATVKEINGAKITDGSIVKGKLDTNVQASLDKADSALQKADKDELAAATKKAQDAADAAQRDVDALEVVVGVPKKATDEGAQVATGIFKKIDDAVSAQAKVDEGQNDRIKSLEDAVGNGGSIDERINNTINGLDATDVATAVVDTNDSTKVGIYAVKENDGVISQGAKIADVDAAGTAAQVKTDITGTDADEATVDTLKGHRKAITALETAIGEGGSVQKQITDKINALDSDEDALLPGEEKDAEAIAVVSGVTETNGLISSVDSVAVDKAGAATRAKTEIIGNKDDAIEANTINGAKNYADSKLNEALTWQEF